MALPKRKKSRSRRDMRRSHDRVHMPQATLCPQCHEPVLPHHLCVHCGTYGGETILEKKET